MKELNILEWNIHQQGRHSNTIPICILDYIPVETDIIVLLEINAKSLNINEFCDKLNKKGYKIYMTDYEQCSNANDILIAVNSRSDIVVKRMSYYIAYNAHEWKNEVMTPENLFLDIQINNKNYVLAAIRIKELKSDYKNRKKQMENFVKWTDEILAPIILLGDFNNLRENTKERDWNLQVLDNIIKSKFIRKTPYNNHSWGVSYYPSENKYDGYIKEDHLLYSTKTKTNINEKAVSVDYSWDFLKNNISKCKVNDKNLYGQQKIEIPIGFPDHAIFSVHINLET